MSSTLPPITQPPAPKPPRFKLSVVAWITWALAAVLVVGLNLSAYPADTDSAYKIGNLVGQVVGLLLMPTLLSWLFWRIFRRSARAGLITFLVVLGILILGQVSESLRRVQQEAVYQKMKADLSAAKSDMIQDIESGGGIALDKAHRMADDTLNAMSDIARNSTGEDKQIALAGEAFMQWAQGLQQAHIQTINAMEMETFLSLERQATKAQRAVSMIHIENFKASNAGLRAYTTDAESRFRQELSQRKVSKAGVERTMAEFLNGFNPGKELLLGIRQTDEDLAEHLSAFVAFAAEVEGQWSIDEKSGGILFQTEEALNRYHAIMNAVNETAANQAALQKQLLGQ